MKHIIHTILITILLLSNAAVYAQTDTAFWFVAPEVSEDGGNLLDRPISLHLATYSLSSTVTISQPANAAFVPIVVNLGANSATSVDLTPYIATVENTPPNVVNDYGIFIQSTSKITVYYEVLGGASSCGYCNPESFSLKGHNALGTSFYTPFEQTYDNALSGYTPTPYGAFDIVSPHDNTQVTINPAQNIVGHNAGIPFTITLNRGQTFSCTASSQIAANHPSGSVVTSNKPVAITVKDDLIDLGGQDLEGDQLIPTNVIGSEYIVVKAPSATNDLAVIVGTQNGTQVSVNGSVVTTVGAGQTYQYALNSSGTGSDYITSTQPIYVYQLTTSDGEAGGAILPPLTCTGSTDVSVTRATPNPFNAFLITQNGNQGNFLCNGSSSVILASAFQPVPSTAGKWVYAVVDLSSTILPGVACRIINSSGLFSLGILEGISGGSNYAYFSDFVTLNNTVTNVNICNPDSVILHPTVTGTHLWNTGSTADSITVKTTGTYWVQSSINGCLITDTFKVVSSLLQPITITPPSTSVCDGKSILLTANSVSALSYQWMPATGLSATSGSTVVANPTVTTTYSVTGTNTNGCTSTATITVIVNPSPILSVTPQSPVVCIGQSISLIANGATSYQWSPATGLSATSGSSVTASPTISTTYTLLGTNLSGCSETIDVALQVATIPVVKCNPPSPSICIGSSAVLSASGASTYQWSPSTGLNSTTGSSVAVNCTTTTTYTVIGSNAPGCTDTESVIITVYPLPTIIVTQSASTVCSGLTDTLNANGGSSYQWSPAIGLNMTTGITVIANPTRSTTYTITGTDANGCTNTANAPLTIKPAPSIFVTPTTPHVCFGQSVLLSASGAVSYQWSPSTSLSATTGTSVVANPVSSTTYTVSGLGLNGCSGSTLVSLTVDSLPIIKVTQSSSSVCQGQNISISASGANDYEWKPSTSLNSSSGTSVIANPTTTATYTVIGTNLSGCKDSISFTITVNPLPAVAISGLNSMYCVNSGTVKLSGGTPQGGTYSGKGVKNNTFDPSTSGVGIPDTITYTYTDNSGCSNSAEEFVTIQPQPIVVITPPNSVLCDSTETVTLNASGAATYSWIPSIGLSSTTAGTVIADPKQRVTYIVTGTNAYGCTNTAEAVIAVDSMPKDSFIILTPNICEPSQIQFINTSLGGAYYHWNFGDGITDSSENTTHTYYKIGTYTITLVVSTALGCSDSTSESVPITATDNFIAMPNAFTPNINGKNDILTPFIECNNSLNYIFRIYNRWGQLIFETSDPNTGWDGKFHGHKEPLDVYVYYVEFTCGQCNIFRKGNITLLQ